MIINNSISTQSAKDHKFKQQIEWLCHTTLNSINQSLRRGEYQPKPRARNGLWYKTTITKFYTKFKWEMEEINVAAAIAIKIKLHLPYLRTVVKSYP